MNAKNIVTYPTFVEYFNRWVDTFTDGDAIAWQIVDGVAAFNWCITYLNARYNYMFPLITNLNPTTEIIDPDVIFQPGQPLSIYSPYPIPDYIFSFFFNEGMSYRYWLTQEENTILFQESKTNFNNACAAIDRNPDINDIYQVSGVFYDPIFPQGNE